MRSAQRGQTPGDDVAEVEQLLKQHLPAVQTLSPGPLLEKMIAQLDRGLLAGVMR